MQGTRDSVLKFQDHAFISFEVYRCNDSTKKDGDPDCKPKKQMRLADGSSQEPVPIETLIKDGADLDKYIEDMEADSIDNFSRNKRVGMKVIN
jgi:hypothetical protein